MDGGRPCVCSRVDARSLCFCSDSFFVFERRSRKSPHGTELFHMLENGPDLKIDASNLRNPSPKTRDPKITHFRVVS